MVEFSFTLKLPLKTQKALLKALKHDKIVFKKTAPNFFITIARFECREKDLEKYAASFEALFEDLLIPNLNLPQLIKLDQLHNGASQGDYFLLDAHTTTQLNAVRKRLADRLTGLNLNLKHTISIETLSSDISFKVQVTPPRDNPLYIPTLKTLQAYDRIFKCDGEIQVLKSGDPYTVLNATLAPNEPVAFEKSAEKYAKKYDAWHYTHRTEEKVEAIEAALKRAKRFYGLFDVPTVALNSFQGPRKHDMSVLEAEASSRHHRYDKRVKHKLKAPPATPIEAIPLYALTQKNNTPFVLEHEPTQVYNAFESLVLLNANQINLEAHLRHRKNFRSLRTQCHHPVLDALHAIACHHHRKKHVRHHGRYIANVITHYGDASYPALQFARALVYEYIKDDTKRAVYWYSEALKAGYTLTALKGDTPGEPETFYSARSPEPTSSSSITPTSYHSQ